MARAATGTRPTTDELAAIRARATFLLALTDADWSEWELQFLDSLVERRSQDPLSPRQREKLDELEHAAKNLRSIDGFRILDLINACWQERFDLDDEDDTAFIERLKSERPEQLKFRPARRLLAIARRLDLAPRYAA